MATVTLQIQDLRNLLWMCRHNEAETQAYVSGFSLWSNQHSQHPSGLVQDLATKIEESREEARTRVYAQYKELFQALEAENGVESALQTLLAP